MSIANAEWRGKEKGRHATCYCAERRFPSALDRLVVSRPSHKDETQSGTIPHEAEEGAVAPDITGCGACPPGR